MRFRSTKRKKLVDNMKDDARERSLFISFSTVSAAGCGNHTATARGASFWFPAGLAVAERVEFAELAWILTVGNTRVLFLACLNLERPDQVDQIKVILN